jgi:hypothetical protein
MPAFSALFDINFPGNADNRKGLQLAYEFDVVCFSLRAGVFERRILRPGDPPATSALPYVTA